MELFLSELWSMEMYLQRRTGGVYYFRMSIPTRLTAAYGGRRTGLSPGSMDEFRSF